jgi:hypothetical protein
LQGQDLKLSLEAMLKVVVARERQQGGAQA